MSPGAGRSCAPFVLSARAWPFPQALPATLRQAYGRPLPQDLVLDAGRSGRDGWRTGVQPLMPKRMLIDATHAEETRVVVLDGNRLEDFDIETSAKRQLKGNIYLAKVVRVEPSLQAAFVEYGGNRHGFLAFGEIHPDYYQIPVADRQRLLDMQAEQARLEDEEDDLELALSQATEAAPADPVPPDAPPPPDAEPWAHAGLPRLFAPVEPESAPSFAVEAIAELSTAEQSTGERSTGYQSTGEPSTGGVPPVVDRCAEHFIAEPWAVAALPA